MAAIQQRQNADDSLRLHAAGGYHYTRAKRFHLVGSGLAVVFALASPVALLTWPEAGPVLGAVAGIWIFMSRLVLEPLRQTRQTRGAAMQECFDCDVLGLPWNTALVRRPTDEEVRQASRNFDPKSATGRDWYPAAGVILSWPRSVLTCQRSNAVWAKRQHRAYGTTLLLIAIAWGVFGIILALAKHATLAQYLTTVALPSLPAMLDATELAKKHWTAADERAEIEVATDELFAAASDVEPAALREVQDKLYLLRRDSPAVAGWFYKLVRTNYEADMQFAAQRRSK